MKIAPLIVISGLLCATACAQDSKRIKQDLVEIQNQLSENERVHIALLQKEEEARQALEKKEESSGEINRLVSAFEKDTRNPTKDNISGVWSVSPNLTGYTFQVEQQGEKVTGLGYYWGCMGAYATFKVSGTYKSGFLTIAFTPVPAKKTSVEKFHFKYSPWDGHPGFAQKRKGYTEWILPQNK